MLPTFIPKKTGPALLGGIALAVFLLLGNALTAGTLTVDDCVSAAIKANLPLAALQAQAQASAWAYRKDRGSLWPALALADEASYSRFGPEAAFADGPENKGNAELSLDLQRWLAPPSRGSQLNMRRNGLLIRQAQSLLKRDVIQAYDKAAVLLRKAEAQRQAGAYVDSHIRDIERLQGSGLDVALDLLRAKSQRRSLDLAANAQEAELLNTLALLRSLSGIDLQASDLKTDVILAEAVPAGPVEAPAVPAEKLDATVQTRLAALDLETARLATLGQGRFAAPTLRLGIDHSFQAIDPNTPGDRGYGSLTFDAFDWGQRANEARQHEAELASQTKVAQDQLRQLRLTASQLAVDIQHARQAYAISTAIMQDAQKGMEIAKAYYRQGKVKESDLLSVFADYLTASDQRDEALLNALGKQAEWDALWEGAQL